MNTSMTSIQWPQIFTAVAVTALWFRDETHKWTIWKCSSCLTTQTKKRFVCGTGWRANCLPCRIWTSTKAHTTNIWGVWMTALLCVINISRSQDLKQGAHVAESWDGHMASLHCLSLVVFNPVSTSLLRSGMMGWTVFENPRLSTLIKNKACSFLSLSVEVWSHVEYSSRFLLL